MENERIANFIKAQEQGNRSSKRSKRMIATAYATLLKTHTPEKITVTKIVELADLNRSTFYSHFTCPEDVYAYIEQREVARLLEYIDKVPIGGRINDPKPLLDGLIGFVEENMELIETLISANRMTRFMEYAKDIVVEKLMDDRLTLTGIRDKNKLELTIRFDVGGLAELISDWFMKKIDIPLRELSDSAAEIIRVHTLQLQ